MSELQIGPDRPVIKKSEKDETEKFFICACHSIEHQAFFWCDEDDKQLYINLHLQDYKGVFKRLLHGLKYIFGHKSVYGDWDEFLFKEEDVKELKRFLKNK